MAAQAVSGIFSAIAAIRPAFFRAGRIAAATAFAVAAAGACGAGICWAIEPKYRKTSQCKAVPYPRGIATAI
jgi:hypothetical protein